MSGHFKYKSVAVGGTFDHIHRGHRSLLKRAFETSEFVYIGLTSNDFVAKQGKSTIHSFEERKTQLIKFLLAEYPSRKYEITKLEERFGPGMFTRAIDGVVVSTETLPTVDSANRKRGELGLPDLKVEVVSMIMADDGDRISSTRIRSGEIDPDGHVLKD